MSGVPPAWAFPSTTVEGISFDGRSGIGWTSISHDIGYFGFVVMMKPGKFLDLAARVGNPRPGVVEYLEGEIRSGNPIAPPFLTLDVADDAGADLPIPVVAGHEGRHRMLAILKVAGDVPVPVLVAPRGRRARQCGADLVERFRAGAGYEGAPSIIVRGPLFEDAFLNGNLLPSPGRVLDECARHYYEACELYEDEDLDPADSLAVLSRAFLTSDCDAFAECLHRMTGWPLARVTWASGGDLGHHTLVRDPEGRFLDVSGYVNEATVRKRYGRDARIVSETGSLHMSFEPTDDGCDADLRRIAAVIRNLPYAPYCDAAFRSISLAEVPGIDVPESVASPPAP